MTERPEEVRRLDKQFCRHFETSDYVDVKTDDDNVDDDADDNGVAGGGTAARQTKMSMRPNRQIHFTLRPTTEQREEARRQEKARRMTNDNNVDVLIPLTTLW